MTIDKSVSGMFNDESARMPFFVNNDFLNVAVKLIVDLGYEFKSHQPTGVGMDRMRFVSAEKGVYEVVYFCDQPAHSFLYQPVDEGGTPASRQFLTDFMQANGIGNALAMADEVAQYRKKRFASFTDPKNSN